MSSDFLLVSVPGDDETSFRNLMRAGASSQNPYGELSKIEIPELLVGTLDSLMTLSDSLHKVDGSIEAVSKKVERTFKDSGGKGTLNVNGVSPSQFVEQFMWDYAKYPHRRALKDLTKLIAEGADHSDDELKKLTNALQEKQAKLQDIKKKKGRSMLTADLSESMTDDMLSRIQILDTDYLKTLFVAVPKALKSNFEATYHKIGDKIVGYGGPDWSQNDRELGKGVSYGDDVDRSAKKGSPVVPGSAKIVKEDFESILYTVTILKSQYESGHYEGSEFCAGKVVNFEELFTKQAREKRYVVKTYTHTPGAAGRTSVLLEELQASVDHMKASLVRWCETHFGEVFSAWIHLKIIRIFAESVLRYGLPVRITSGCFKVSQGYDANLRKSLTSQFAHLAPGSAMGGDEEEVDGEEFLPYVFQRFSTDRS